MRIDLYPTVVNMPDAESLSGRTAVVIDVLRATTTIVTALCNGAAAVHPVLTPEEALERVPAFGEAGCLLGGERGSLLIPGFDLGNSPLEYTAQRVAGRHLLMTTTNGTRAIRRAAAAPRLYLSCLLNVPAVADRLAREGADVAICCAGTHDQFSLEDSGCAGAIISALTRMGCDLQLNDLALVAGELAEGVDGEWEELLRLSEHGGRLVAMELDADIRACAAYGTVDVIPHLTAGGVVAGR